MEDDRSSDAHISFKDKTIEELIKSNLKDPAKTKINHEAIKLTSGLNIT